MGRLVDDLLAFSRLEAQAIRKERVSTRDFVRDVAREVSSEPDRRDVVFEIGDLPDCDADPSLLRQVWFNLLSYAFKFTRPHSSARIEIGSAPRSGGTTYFVRDDGVGLDLGHANRLFQVFHRLHKETEFDGTGLGLSIVRRIVERHGGSVWAAEAAPEHGATFCFTLTGAPGQGSSIQDPGRLGTLGIATPFTS